ncbi:Ig-like domain-containing protein [Metapseudomonas otitidis]|uniref:Ig-like domain-containing protein n=1 Tax=Metapseudomonas otitidis TaxID=319939 RepID=UPI0013F6528C|nr:Ig-like domain-containing protein [Pseudomonas otitidis]
MKNLIDSSLYFSVIVENSLMQAHLLDATQVGTDQTLMTTPGALHILQQPEAEPLEETLVASRSSDDLLLAFHSPEALPVLTLQQFFANDGQLHILRKDGELLLGITALEQPQQGPLSFSTESLGSFGQQAEAPMLAALHQAMFTEEPAPVALMAAADQPLRIINAVDALGGITGKLYSGDVTDDKFAPLQGTGPAGAILEIINGAEVIGEVKVGSDGNWTFEQESALAEGGHVFTSRVKGNSESSDVFALIIDSIAPPRVVIEGIYDDRGGGLIKIGSSTHTNDSTPLLKGTAEKLSVVEIFNGKTLIGTARANGKGEWTFAPPFTLPDGDYSITAKASDYTGNTGLASLAYKFTIDTQPPATPTILKAFDNVGDLQGDLTSGALTDDRTPTLSGKAEAGVTVLVYRDGKLLGTAETNSAGDWSFTPSADLLDGQHSFTAVARDKAGNSSTESDAFELTLGRDRTQAPTLDSVLDDVGTIQGALAHGSETDDVRPTLNGSAKAGDRVEIFLNGILLDEVVADSNGYWTYTPVKDLTEGTHTFQVRALNDTHSPSELSPPFHLVVDTTPPDAAHLRITSVLDDVGSITGNVAQGGRTDDRNPTISGVGTASDIIILYVTESDGQREVGRTVVNGDGTWSVQVESTLADGMKVFTAVATDAAGNLSPHSAGYSITITSNDAVGGYNLGGNQSSGAAINTTVVGHQNNPQVTKLANGNLVVAWQQNVKKESGGYDVVMQIMDSTGKYKIGAEQLVNQRNINNQDSPQIVALADGGFLIAFESYQASSLDNSEDGIFARRYNADGAAQTDEFLVNQTTSGAQRSPKALSLPDGGYIIAWTSAQGGSSIMHRVYDANNQPVGNEQVIKAGGASHQTGGAEMALFENSDWYITVWCGGDGNGNGVLGQLRKIDGSTAGPVLTLNTTRDASQQFPDVITLKDGSFVAFWDSNDSKANGSDIRAAHYRFNPVSGESSLIGNSDFIVNRYTAGKQYKPVGVALEDGGYMLIWGSEGGDGDGSAIYAQRFDANSQKVGHEFLVNPSTWGNQGSGWDDIDLENILDATLMEDGNIFVTWHSDKIDPDGYGIEGVTLDIDAGFYSEFIVNTSTKDQQTWSTTTALPNGGFVVAWQSNSGGSDDVKAQLYDAAGMPIGNEFLVNVVTAEYQGRPSVITLSDGTFVVGYHSWENDRTIVRTQRFGYTHDESGNITGTTRIGGEKLIDRAGFKYNNAVKLTAMDDGGYLAVWQGRTGDDKPWQVVAAQYDAAGKQVPGSEAVLSAGFSQNPNVASTAIAATIDDGRVVITYAKETTVADIYFRIYDPKSQTYGNEVRANQTTNGLQGTPSASKLANGNFIVTWDSYDTNGPDQSGSGVWARIYSPEGTPMGNEFLMNTFTPNIQKRPVTVSRPEGGFVAVYSSQADSAPGQGSFGIYLQFFDDAGNRVGQEMRVNQLVYGDQEWPELTFLADGRLFVTWTDYGVGDGSGSAIKGRIIDLDTTLGLGVTPQDAAAKNGVAPLADDVQQGNLWMLFDDGSASSLLLDNPALSSVRGGAGNDFIAIKGSSFAMIDGGDGIDTLLLDGKHMELDLDALMDRITGIEKIDLGQGGSNSLSLSADALEGLGQADMVLADGKNQLVINGDNSNSVQLLDGLAESWVLAGQAEVGGVIYQTYVSGSNELLIEQNIQVSLM